MFEGTVVTKILYGCEVSVHLFLLHLSEVITNGQEIQQSQQKNTLIHGINKLPSNSVKYV